MHVTRDVNSLMYYCTNVSFLSTFISLQVTFYAQMCYFCPYLSCAIIVCAVFVCAILGRAIMVKQQTNSSMCMQVLFSVVACVIIEVCTVDKCTYDVLHHEKLGGWVNDPHGLSPTKF